MIDGVTRVVVGERIEGEKTWPASDPVFEDHFPGMPIVPGTLITEASAQLLGVLIEMSVAEKFGASVYPLLSLVNKAKFQKLYRREIDGEKGMTKVTALQLAGDRIRAMLIDGENAVVSDPDRHHCEHALTSLDHLVVIDIFLTETAQRAHVVLPGATFAEKDGTFTSMERRVQRVHRAIPPLGGKAECKSSVHWLPRWVIPWITAIPRRSSRKWPL